MILSNIPCLIAQIILYFAKNVEMLYASSSLMALSIGFQKAPVLGYTGEVCEPKLRGILVSSMTICYYMGTIILTMMNSITKQWRLTVILATVFPILTIIKLFTVIGYLYTIDIVDGLNDHQPNCMVYVLDTRISYVVIGQRKIFKSTTKSAHIERKSIIRKM